MQLAVFNMVIDGEINVKDVDKFLNNLIIATETLSQVYNVEPLKSLYEKYRDEVKGLEELKDKDDIFYFSYLANRIFDDYFNNGKLKGLLDEISKLKIDKKQLLKEVEKKEGKAEEKGNLTLPVIWYFRTQDLLGLIKKLNASFNKEFESEYLGLKVHVEIKPFQDEIGVYDPFVFFTKNKPRLGIKFGEISVDPYETRILQFSEDRANFILHIVEKVCGKLSLKSKMQVGITDPFKFKNTEYLIRALRYTHWTLRSSKLSLSEVVSYLPIILNIINKPRQFVKSITNFHDKIQEEGVDLDYIKKEIENLGWYSIKLPSRPNRGDDRGIVKLKKFFDLSMKLGDPIILLSYLFTSIIYVYKVNGYEYRQLFEI
ncbi:MAG: hypothetical protein QXV69_09870 [Sulfolobaceae archaeon]